MGLFNNEKLSSTNAKAKDYVTKATNYETVKQHQCVARDTQH